jgi:GAF domain-containing protein
MEDKRAPKEAPKPVAAPIAEVPAKVQIVAAPAAAPVEPIGRKEEKGGNIEDVLADIFSEVMDLWSTCKTKEDVASFMLDLSLRKINAESGGVFFADIAGGDLMFLAARGPKAREVMKFKVPMGVGIVGFCAGSGVSVAISDVNKDPRWYNLISKSTGYDTKSILCSVVQYDGQSLGAIELVNKKGNATFTLDELNILNYIAHEAGDALARVLDQEFAAKSKK